VLITLANELQRPRIGVAAGRSLGNAVQRNRAKRVLREAIRPIVDEIAPGYDILLLGRRAILSAKSPEVRKALAALIEKAGLRKQL
jgi:ribonuclease P protein component